MKKLLSITLCILLLTALAIPAMATGMTFFSMSTSTNTLYRGDTVTFTVTVSSSEPATSYGFMLSYDSSVFELVNGSCTVSGTLVSSFNNGFAFMFQSETAYSGTVGTVTFRVKDNAAFGNFTISGSASVKNGSTQVDASGYSQTITISCAHSYGSWTKVDDTTHKRTCSICKKDETANHTWNSGAIAKQPSCKEEGIKTIACTACNTTKTESIAKTTDHKYGSWTKVNDTTHKHTCSVCSKEEIANHTWNSGAITKRPTCKEEGVKTFTCTGCNATKTESIAKTTDHKYGSWTKVNDTTHKHTCSVCSKEEIANHTWNSGAITKQPTCKEKGVKTFTCTGCNATKTESIAKTTDHKYGSWTKVNDTTHKHTCSVCFKDETANHIWNNGAITKQPTCKEEGVKTFTCTACNATKAETIEKLTTHTYDHACDTDCNVCGVTRTATHNYKTSWNGDKTNHWHECSICWDKKDVAAHTPGTEATETTAQTCTTCGYMLKAAIGHKHNYATTWTTDDAGHWHACSGCAEKDSYTAHDFENVCDKDCSVCGFTREIEHKFAETWTTDTINHWHVCSGCDLKQDEAAHEPGAEATAATAQTCTICGYEIAPSLGVDETTESAQSANVTTSSTPTEETHSEDGNFTGGIVIIVVVATVGCIALLVVIKKKKS